MEYEYLVNCYNESLRIEPPVAQSSFLEMDEDSTINIGDKKSILLKKGSRYVINQIAIHHDPKQWIESDVYCPDRFDTKSPDNKWTKTADGKTRSPLAFTPFLGGKRVCIGKTFAEVTIRYTIPMIFYHVDFEFLKSEQATEYKPAYSISNPTEPKMPMKVTIKNKII